MKIETPLIDLYITKDIYLASTLITLGFPVKELQWQEKQCTFIFENDTDLENSVDKYWENGLQVNPQALYNSFKQLKSRMYNE